MKKFTPYILYSSMLCLGLSTAMVHTMEEAERAPEKQKATAPSQEIVEQVERERTQRTEQTRAKKKQQEDAVRRATRDFSTKSLLRIVSEGANPFEDANIKQSITAYAPKAKAQVITEVVNAQITKITADIKTASNLSSKADLSLEENETLNAIRQRMRKEFPEAEIVNNEGISNITETQINTYKAKLADSYIHELDSQSRQGLTYDSKSDSVTVSKPVMGIPILDSNGQPSQEPVMGTVVETGVQPETFAQRVKRTFDKHVTNPLNARVRDFRERNLTLDRADFNSLPEDMQTRARTRAEITRTNKTLADQQAESARAQLQEKVDAAHTAEALRLENKGRMRTSHENIVNNAKRDFSDKAILARVAVGEEPFDAKAIESIKEYGPQAKADILTKVIEAQVAKESLDDTPEKTEELRKKLADKYISQLQKEGDNLTYNETNQSIEALPEYGKSEEFDMADNVETSATGFKTVSKSVLQKITDWVQSLFSAGDLGGATAAFTTNAKGIAEGTYDPKDSQAIENKFRNLDTKQKESVFNSWLKTRMSHFNDAIEGIKKGAATHTPEETAKSIKEKTDQALLEMNKFVTKMQHFLSPDQILLPVTIENGPVQLKVLDMSAIDPTKPLSLEEFEKNDKTILPDIMRPYARLTTEVLADQVATHYAKNITINTASPVEVQMKEHIANWDNFNPKIKEDILNKLGVKTQFDDEASKAKGAKTAEAAQRLSTTIENIKDAVRLPKIKMSRDEVRAEIFQRLETNPKYNTLDQYNKGKIVNELETKYNEDTADRQRSADAQVIANKEAMENEIARRKVSIADAQAKLDAQAKVEAQAKVDAQAKLDAQAKVEAQAKVDAQRQITLDNRNKATEAEKKSAIEHAKKIISAEARETNSPIVFEKNPRYRALKDEYLAKRVAVKAAVKSQLQTMDQDAQTKADAQALVNNVLLENHQVHQELATQMVDSNNKPVDILNAGAKPVVRRNNPYATAPGQRFS